MTKLKIYETYIDELIQANLTLQACWIEQSGIKIEDDQWVKDAVQTVNRIRAEQMN